MIYLDNYLIYTIWIIAFLYEPNERLYLSLFKRSKKNEVI